MNKRCRPHLKATNKSYRVDETYIKVKGQEKYFYRAVDSTGQTIDFLLTAKRYAAAAKRSERWNAKAYCRAECGCDTASTSTTSLSETTGR